MASDRKNTNQTQKGLLMIAYWFPPMKTVSLRSYYFYQQAKKWFDRVQVFTTDNNKRLAQEPFPIEKKEITTLRTYDYRTLLQSGNTEKNSFTVDEKQGKWRQRFIKLINSFPLNLIIGEGGILYIIDGYRRGKRIIEEGNFSHIFSSYRPYADHGIGYLLKRKFPDIYWIADCRDVHVEPNVSTVYWKSFQHFCNKKILSRADVITTVSKGLAIQLRKYNSSVKVLKNGFHRLPNAPTTPHTTEKFQLVYTGSLFYEKRNPLLLLQAIQQLIEEQKIDPSKITIKYAGQDGGLWQKWLRQTNTENLFDNLGVIPRKEALQLQFDAQVNFLLTYNSQKGGGNLTGKFYEYLFAKSPLLIVMNGSYDAEFEVITQAIPGVEIAYSESQDIQKIANFILPYYQKWLTTKKAEKVIPEYRLTPFTWDSMVVDFLKAIEV